MLIIWYETLITNTFWWKKQKGKWKIWYALGKGNTEPWQPSSLVLNFKSRSFSPHVKKLHALTKDHNFFLVKSSLHSMTEITWSSCTSGTLIKTFTWQVTQWKTLHLIHWTESIYLDEVYEFVLQCHTLVEKGIESVNFVGCH